MASLTAGETPAFLRDLLTNEHDARDQILRGNLDPSQLPIPHVTVDTTRYTTIPAAAVLIQDELIDLNKVGFNTRGDYYFHEARFNPIYGRNFTESTPQVMFLRSLAERLAETNDFLRKTYGVEFEAMNGFRSLSVQRKIFEAFYQAGIRKYAPTYEDTALESKAMEFALTYASRPPEKVSLADSTTWYAHGTGAAIDVLLRSESGARLEFGVIFDDPDSLTHVRAFEEMHTEASSLSKEAFRANRRMLFWSMASTGFVNYPEEFFHFDPYQISGCITQFAILNGQNWGIPGAAALRATVPAAREALTE